MDSKTVAALLRRDLRAGLAELDDAGRLRALQAMEPEYEEALGWMKRTVARAIATETRMGGESPEAVAQRERQQVVVDQMKQALRALHDKRDQLERMVDIVRGRRGATRTLRRLAGDPEPVPPLRVHVDVDARYIVSRDHEPPLLLTVHGPPGGMDTLLVFRAPSLVEGHEGVRLLWAATDPNAQSLLKAQVHEGRAFVGRRDLPALAVVQPSMPPRHYTVMACVAPFGGPALVVVRKLDSGEQPAWARLRACPLLASLRVE